MEPIISVQDLSKIYRVDTNRIVAVDHVSLDIYPGEFCTIVGPSGSGKSTLLYLLAGIERPTKGMIRVARSRIDPMTENELVKFRLKNVGFIFQSFNLMNHKSALENVALPLTFKGVGRFDRKLSALRMLKSVGLGKHYKHKPTQLSGGQQQRVSIARALITNPDIIFADEPTGNLDSHTGQEVTDLLTDLVHEQHKTLVMVTHDAEKTRNADRIIHLLDGQVTDIETPQPKEVTPL